MSAWRADETGRHGGTLTASNWWPWGITVFDYDNDGDQDILICQHSGAGCTIARSNLMESGTLTFTDITTSLVADKRLLPVAAGKPKIFDFDRDGWLDILGLFNQRSFFNNQGNSFTEIPHFNLAINYPRWDKTDYSNLGGVRDLNGDGYLDVTNLASEYLYSAPGRTFVRQTTPSYTPPVLPAQVQAVIEAEPDTPEKHVDYYQYDLNNDGRDDILVSGYTAYGPLKFMRILIRQSDGTLSDQTSQVGFDGSSYAILVEDFNQDHRLDMLVGRGSAPGLYLANPDFTYTRVRNENIESTVGTYNTSYPDSAWAIDLDQDQDLDLVISGRYSALLDVYENNGSGLMTPVLTAGPWPRDTTLIPWPGGAEPVDFADMNNDGLIDIVLGTCSNCYSQRVDNIIVLLNNSRPGDLAPDIAPPVLSNGMPTAIVPANTSTIISLSTNESATCKYSTAPGVPYTSMINVLTTTNGTSHSRTISGSSGLISGNTYHYYIRCIDTNGNKNTQDFTITFSVGTSAIDSTPPAVVSGHPRLFLTPTLLTTLRNKAAAGDSAWLELKSEADALLAKDVAPYSFSTCPADKICYGYFGYGWLNPIEKLSLAYQLTGVTAYASKVLEILDAMNDTVDSGNMEPLTADLGYASRNLPLALGIAYDWVYDRLDQATKDRTVHTLNVWFDLYKDNPLMFYQHSGPAYGDYFGGHLVGFGLGSLSMSGDNSRAGEINLYIRALFNETVAEAFTSGGFAGGYAAASYNYGSYQFEYLLWYMLAVKTATGKDIGIGEYGRKIARNIIYNLKPNRWQSSDEGSFPGAYTGVMIRTVPLLLSYALAGTAEGAWMQFMYHDFKPSPGYSYSGLQTPPALDRFLWSDESRAAFNYKTVAPMFLRSLGDEHVYVRSSWSDSAIWASFAAGGKVWDTGAEMRKAGHLAIQRGTDYLLVNSGQWKGQDGWVGSPSAFSLAGWRANTLYFDDLGEYMYTGEAFVGGQGYWGSNRIMAYEATSDYIYSKANLTDSYDKDTASRNPSLRSLSNFTRAFISVGDGVFVLYDRIKSLKDYHIKKLYWHLNKNGVPQEIAPNKIKSVVNTSSLFIETLAPRSAVSTFATDPASFDTGFVTHRVEVSDSVPGTDFNPLTVLVAADRQAPVPFTSLLESVNMIGSIVATDLSKPHTVMFSKDGTPQSSVTYTVDYTSLLSVEHLLVDMQPGTYDIYRDGVELLSGVSASSEGVLSFRSLAGATFQIVQVGVSVPPSPETSEPPSGGGVPPSPGTSEPLSGGGTTPAVFAGGVVNNASFAPNPAPVAPGSIVAVFGIDQNDGSTWLFSGFGPDGKLVNTLAGARVTINDIPAPLFYSTPGQLGIQIPFELAGQASAEMKVTVAGRTSQSTTVLLAPFAPGIFTTNQQGTGLAAALHQDGVTPVTKESPAHPGEVIVFFATGLGALSPPLETGKPSAGNITASVPTVAIDGVPAEVLFSGAAPGFVGLNQINLRIPAGTRTDANIPVVLTIGGTESNAVTIPVGP